MKATGAAATAAPPTSAPGLTLLQRSCACGGDKSGDCDDCSRKKLRRRAASQTTAPHTAPPVVGEVLNSPGRPLDEATRAFMEPRFGHDFSKVRVHADERAAESARSVGALAYTVGNNVVFNAGQFAPQTRPGLHLLAHELAHVVQQQGDAGARSVASESSEGRSDAPGLRSGPALARQTGDESPPPSTSTEPLNTAPAEREREVEVIESGDKSYVLYQTVVRFNGSSSWLANNPGNMDYTENTVRWGAYDGKKLKWGQHGFAIFPSEAQGLHAVRSFLKEFAGERDIKLMMELFSPASDQNDPDAYAAKVAAKLGVPATTLVKTLNDAQRERFAKVIQEEEGWKVGDEKPRGDPALPENVRKRI
ncbi:MAG: DUF4157 domain-containing protein [Pyrinomonadaceae bacterium]